MSLVLFTAPNCASCSRVRDRVARVNEALRDDKSVAAIVVDGTREPDLVARYGIRGFPALVTFRYNAARDSTTFAHYSSSLASAEDILAYMSMQTGPTCTEVRTYAELRRALAQNFTVGTAALGVFTEAPGKPDAKAYKVLRRATLRSHHHPRCFVTSPKTSPALAKDLGLRAPNIYLVDEVAVDLTMKLKKASLPPDALRRMPTTMRRVPKETATSVEQLVKYLQVQTQHLVDLREDKLGHSFLHTAPGMHQLVVLTPWTPALNDQLKRVLINVAPKTRTQIAHVMMSLKAEASREFLHYADASRVTSPSGVLVFAVNTTSRFKYMFTGQFNEAELGKFEQDFLRGTLPHAFRSEKRGNAEEAIRDADGVATGVVEVVGSRFGPTVLHEGVDVLLMLYAPWCHECARYQRTLQQLALRFALIKSIRIAQIDWETNDAVVGGRVLAPLSFPSFIFFPAHDKESPVWLRGSNFTLHSLTQFVQRHAEISFDESKVNLEHGNDGDDAAETKQCGIHEWPEGVPSDKEKSRVGMQSVSTGSHAKVQDEHDVDDHDDDEDEDEDDNDNDNDNDSAMSEEKHTGSAHRAEEQRATKQAMPSNMTAVFTNKLSRVVDLYYDVKLWSRMKPGTMVSVTTYTGHVWSVQVDSKTLIEWKMDSAKGVQQEFDVTEQSIKKNSNTVRQSQAQSSTASTSMGKARGVISISSQKSLTALLKKYLRVLVAFFAPDSIPCDHCEALKPHFQRAAATLRREQPPTLLVQYDLSHVSATERADVLKHFDVQMFPSYKLIYAGKSKALVGNYFGGIMDSEIIAYFRRGTATKQNPHLIKRLRSVKQCNAFLSNYRSVVVLYIRSQGSKYHTMLEELAMQFRAVDRTDVPFTFTTNSAVGQHFKLKKPPSLTILQSDDKVLADDSSKTGTMRNHHAIAALSSVQLKRSLGSVAQFIRSAALPPVIDYSVETHNEIFSHTRSDSRLAIVASETDFADGVKAIVTHFVRKEFGNDGKAVSGNPLLVVTVRPSERLMLGVLGVLDAFQEHATRPPMAIILNTTSFETYRLQKKVTVRSLQTFVKDYADGHLSPTIRSQPKVALQSSSSPKRRGVMEISGSQYERLVFETDHDVLVWLYHSWCDEHAACAKFARTLRTFGHFASMNGTTTLSVYKMGLLRNSAPNLPSRGSMAGALGIVAFYTGLKGEARRQPILMPPEDVQNVDSISSFVFRHSTELNVPFAPSAGKLAHFNASAGWESYDPAQITAVFCSKIKKVAILQQNGLRYAELQPGARLLVTTFNDHNWTAHVKGKLVHSWRMNSDRGPRQKLVVSRQKRVIKRKMSRAH